MKKIKLLIALSVFVTLNSVAQYTRLFDFDSINGSNPYGSLISDGTFLYGMTRGGGTHNDGTIFKIKTDGTGYVKLFDFDGSSNGSAPYGSLIFDGTFLYGTTSTGGAMNCGTIFKIKPDGTGYSTLLNFNYANGKSPHGGELIFIRGFLYGLTEQGGANGYGVIFKIKTDGTGYVTLYNFDDMQGSYPDGSLIFDGTYLYGMTSSDAGYGGGKIFKIKPDGTGYTTILTFKGTNGSGPMGSLVFGGTFLYGMTNSDAGNGYGKIFKVKPDGTGYTNLHTFNGTNEGQPYYTSLIYDGTYLYGMTSGVSHNGNIFKIKPDGTYINLMTFSGANGSMPFGSLISDGIYIYGMTKYGGAGDKGVVFRYQYKVCAGSPATCTQSPVVCNSLTVGSHTYTVSGTYKDTLKRATNACDSIITTFLTIKPTHTFNQRVTKTQGQSVTIGPHTYTAGGIYMDVIPGAQVNGCDSTVITHLTLLPVKNTKRVIKTVTLCTLSFILLAGLLELFLFR